MSPGLRRAAAPALALLLGLLLVEGLLRLAQVAYPAFDRPTPGLRQWGIPKAEGWAVGETRTWVKLNAQGARDVDHEIAKPQDTLRIVVVGDSYTDAFEVEREQAFPAVAERRLGECPALGGRSVEMINLGRRGYGTTEELLALRRFGFVYDPDWVVLAFLTGNDFRNNARALRDSDRPYHVYDGEGTLVLDESYMESADFRRRTGWRGDLWYGLLDRSRLFQLLRHLARRIEGLIESAAREPEGAGFEPGLDDRVYLEPDDPAWRSAWRVTEGVIRKMHDEVRAHDARFLLLTLSNAIQVHPDRELRERHRRRVGAKDLFYPDRRLRAFAKEEGIEALVLAPELREWTERNETCIHGFEGPWLCRGHWNALGHRLAGERLAERLCAELEARPRAARSGRAAPSDRFAALEATLEARLDRALQPTVEIDLEPFEERVPDQGEDRRAQGQRQCAHLQGGVGDPHREQQDREPAGRPDEADRRQDVGVHRDRLDEVGLVVFDDELPRGVPHEGSGLGRLELSGRRLEDLAHHGRDRPAGRGFGSGRRPDPGRRTRSPAEQRTPAERPPHGHQGERADRQREIPIRPAHQIAPVWRRKSSMLCSRVTASPVG